MNPNLIKKFFKLTLNKNLVNLFYIFFFISLILVFLAIYFQPFVGDDHIIQEKVLNNITFNEYFNHMYSSWSARFSLIFISYWIYSDNLNLVIYKLSIIPLFLLTFHFFLKKFINSKIKFFSIDFIILFICLWFIYPAIDETIIWTAGSFSYLIPLLFSIFYLSLFNQTDYNDKKNIFVNFFYLIFSFLAGSSHMQVFVGCFVVSSYFMFLYYKKNKKVFRQLVLFYILFLLGGAFSLSAPGNFERLEVVSFDASIISIIYKSVLFIISSVFYLGDVQSSLIYFLLIILLFVFFSKKNSIKILSNKSNFVWIFAFLFSLIFMITATNAISTRTIFFPIFFLTVFFLKIIFLKYDLNYQLKIKNVIFYILVILFFLESFLGSVTNYVYKKEYNERINIINNTRNNSEDYAEVPHYTIIPSRLTYILTPEQDKNDLDRLSKFNKIKIEYKYNANLPRSKNIRKNIKFFFNN
ncbi:oligosaccharide repeat unit polymerase [Candidatus Pelagibacter sp.]|nr:oligosaccharide repeat unit polymerase [Candidatus Pelagibacter sp.]